MRTGRLHVFNTKSIQMKLGFSPLHFRASGTCIKLALGAKTLPIRFVDCSSGHILEELATLCDLLYLLEIVVTRSL